MRPLVGISQCLDERGRWRPGRPSQFLDCSYAHAVEAAGGTPMYLPIQRDPESLLSRIDGLLLPGGGDFLPSHPYPASVRFEPAPPELLDFDGRLLAASLERDLPVLGICYGMQLLAIQCRGTLHYHVPSDLPKASSHELPEPDGRHAIVVTEGSRLAEILGPAPDPVNSRHHQAVADPGVLRVAARAEDGLVEAVEGEGRGFCIGVQWHPERMDGPHRERLFAAFVDACRKRSPEPS